MNQQQQQRQMIQDDQQTHSNLVKTHHVILTGPNSASTVNLNEAILPEPMHSLAPRLTNRSASLRSLLKTSGLFNQDSETPDKLNELFANGSEFTLHRLLSDFGANDMSIDMNELFKFDPMKLLDARSFSELLPYDSFDQIHAPITQTTDSESDQFESIPPSAIACSSGSFTELCPPTPEPTLKEIYRIEADQLKMEPENPLIYAGMDAFDNFVFTPTTSTPTSQEFSFDPSVVAAFEHDYGYLPKRSPVMDTPSPSPITSKRTPTRGQRRTSSRLQSRVSLLNINQILNDESCSSPAMSENSSKSSARTKRLHAVSRATDIKTADDLTYYLERRRKNNEASKMSRAARKQKFGDMDVRCAEYERVNAELRLKISTLEVVTANLKNGLIHSFQRKDGVNSKN